MQDELGRTALFASSQEGHFDVTSLLLQHGAVVNYQDEVRLLYVHGQHGVAQNGVLSLEHGGTFVYVHGHHSVWVIDACRMVG